VTQVLRCDVTFGCHQHSRPAADHPLVNAPLGVAVADFNQDGHADFVAPGEFSSEISVYLGKGDGRIEERAPAVVRRSQEAQQPAALGEAQARLTQTRSALNALELTTC
jgi:hypothetical protein